MIDKWQSKSIWVYRKPIDFRKQLNGLVQTIIDETNVPPDRNGIYLFQNRQRDKLKLLAWDRNGFFMGYKRLERGKFDFPSQVAVVEMSADELSQLMAGMPMIYLGKSDNSAVFFS
jgi:transposase